MAEVSVSVDAADIAVTVVGPPGPPGNSAPHTHQLADLPTEVATDTELAARTPKIVKSTTPPTDLTAIWVDIN